MKATQPQATHLLTAGAVVTSGRRFAPGWVLLAGERVVDVGTGGPPRADTVTALSGTSTVIPGLVDMHVHGAGGGDMTSGDRTSTVRALQALLGAGVTSCVASLVTVPEDELLAGLSVLAGLTREPPPHAARLLGTHLEGPFLSPLHRGAHHGASLRLPDLRVARRLVDAGEGTLRMLTLAPELPEAGLVLDYLRAEGVVAAMGHTAATFDQTHEAVARGIRVGTHLFNGMRQPHHREPGPALSLLADDRVVVELINDGQHVHPAVARVARRAAGEGRLAIISDGVAATAAPDGSYRLGRVDIRSADGRVETADGSSLGGGVITLDAALRRAVDELGMDVVSAVEAVTSVPARALGASDRAGSLEPGRQADLCVIDDDLVLVGVMLAGEWARQVATSHR